MLLNIRINFSDSARSCLAARLAVVVAASVAGFGGAQAVAGQDGASVPSAADLAVLNEINAARADPHAYARALRADLAYFHGHVFEAPGRTALMTDEGAPAVEEAIAELERRDPQPPLQPDSAIGR